MPMGCCLIREAIDNCLVYAKQLHQNTWQEEHPEATLMNRNKYDACLA